MIKWDTLTDEWMNNGETDRPTENNMPVLTT